MKFWQTTKGRAIERLAYLVASSIITAVIGWLGNWNDTAWFPIVYFLLKTAGDYLNKNIPN